MQMPAHAAGLQAAAEAEFGEESGLEQEEEGGAGTLDMRGDFIEEGGGTFQHKQEDGGDDAEPPRNHGLLLPVDTVTSGDNYTQENDEDVVGSAAALADSYENQPKVAASLN